MAKRQDTEEQLREEVKPKAKRIVKKKAEVVPEEPALVEEVKKPKLAGSDELSTLRKKVRLYEDYLSYSKQYEAYNDYIARFYEVEQ